jgi:hypothetical protein
VSNLFGSLTSSNALLTVLTAPPCATPPTGLVSWWAAEGNALDSADSNHGTLQGGATFALGMAGQAFSFNGQNGSVLVPDSTNLRLTNQVTIEAWVNTRSSSAAGSVVSKVSTATGDNGYAFLVVGNTLQGFFNSPGQGWPSQRIISGPVINTGVWYHVAFTYDQSATRLYCNGVAVATNVIGAHAIAASASNVRIGNDDSGNSPFEGLIDEPAVYNRALSDAEIAAIYNAGSSGKCPPAPATNCASPPAGLVGWWAGEGSALDSTGVNSGSVQGATTFAPGVAAQAFNFSPASGTVVVPDSPSLRLTNQLTIEAWINARSTNGNYGLVCKDGGAGGNNGYQFVLNGNMLQGLFNSPGQPWPSASISSSGIIGTGAWYHVAFTYDQSVMMLYCNGRPVATNAIGAKAIATSISKLHISGDDNNHAYFDGLIDEPSVYNRALSAAEIAGIYNAGSSGKCGLPPSIMLQPQGQTATAGANVSFTAAASGTPPLSYQWQLNSAPIAGATASALVLTNLQDGQAGTYRVVVSNPFGSVTSSNAGLTVLPAPPCATPPTGLVSWWAGESNAFDLAGTNNGALQGVVSFSPGEVGQAFNFNPASGTVVVPDSPSLRLTNQLTIEAWINARTLSGSSGYVIVSKLGGAGGNNGYQFNLIGNTIQGLFNSPGQAWPSASLFSGPVITTGVWYHVAYTYDQSAIKLYCNGLPVATNVIGAKAIAASISRLRISGDDNNHSYFDGLIDEPAVYNRALSDAEIAAIYNAGSSGKCKTSPLTPPFLALEPASQTLPAGGAANLVLTVPTEAGATYVVEYKETLADPTWHELTTIAGTGSSIPISDNRLTNTTRFYRVRVR